MDEVMEAQRIEWQNEVINAVIALVYEGDNAEGVMRAGHYNISRNVLKIAIAEYLESGIDVLDEHDRLIYLSWNSGERFSSPSGPFLCVRDEDIELFNKALEVDNFWDIYSMFSDETIQEIKEWIEECQFREEQLKTYKHKRKRGFTEKLKKQVKSRDENECTKCGYEFELEVHHIKPLIMGGDNSIDNLITLCRRCHVSAHRKLNKGGKQ